MVDPKHVKTYSLKSRSSKVALGDFSRRPVRRATFRAFYASLPNILKGKEIRDLVRAIAQARKRKKAVIFMAGAHVIKCGLNPAIIELMRRKVITCLALNGAGVIHDFELAFQGKTSEDVAANLKNGTFGMGRETADFINEAVNDGVAEGLGFGASVCRAIAAAPLRYKRFSLLYHAAACGIPVCVHVALGTDIIHQHASFNGGRAGEGSIRDFYQLTESIRGLNRGGVVLNFGSAVIMPEVFLKALNLARNLGFRVKDFTTANFDMIYHYRPAQNVVSRPVESGGKGYYIIGHHEIMLPLLAQAVIDTL